jgi:hypothetical protein
MKVKDLESIGASPDGQTIIARFHTEGSEPLEVEFNPFTLETTLADLAGALDHVWQANNLSSGLARAGRPAQYRVDRAEADGEAAVLIAFRMPNNLVHRFSLAPKEARILYRSIREVVKQETPKPTRRGKSH